MLNRQLSTKWFRNWLGQRIFAQEAGHRKLQRRRDIATQLLPVHATTSIMHYWHYRASFHHGAGAQLLEA